MTFYSHSVKSSRNANSRVRPDTHEKSLAQKLTNGINALICINQQDLNEDVDVQVLFNTRCFLLCGPDTPFPAHKISSRSSPGIPYAMSHATLCWPIRSEAASVIHPFSGGKFPI